MERVGEFSTAYAAAQDIGPKVGVRPESLRRWIVQSQIDQGDKPGVSSEEAAEVKRPGKQVRELEQANEILKAASIFFAGGARPPMSLIVEFIDEMKAKQFVVEQICNTLGELGLCFSPRAYRAARCRPLSARAISDQRVIAKLEQIRTPDKRGRVAAEVMYGRRKMWAYLKRNGFEHLARCTLERIMTQLGMVGLRALRN